MLTGRLSRSTPRKAWNSLARRFTGESPGTRQRVTLALELLEDRTLLDPTGPRVLSFTPAEVQNASSRQKAGWHRVRFGHASEVACRGGES